MIRGPERELRPSLEGITDEYSLRGAALMVQDWLNDQPYLNESDRDQAAQQAAKALTEAGQPIFAGQLAFCSGEVRMPTVEDGELASCVTTKAEIMAPFIGFNYVMEAIRTEDAPEGGGTLIEESILHVRRVQLGYALDTGLVTTDCGQFGPTKHEWWLFAPAETACLVTEDTHFEQRLADARARFEPDDELIEAIDGAFGEEELDLNKLGEVFGQIYREAETRGRDPEDYLIYLHAATGWEERTIELMSSHVVILENIKEPDVPVNSTTTLGEFSGTFLEFCLSDGGIEGLVGRCLCCVIKTTGAKGEDQLLLTPVNNVTAYKVHEYALT